MTSFTTRWTMRTTTRTWGGGQTPTGWTCQWHGHNSRWVASFWLSAWALCFKKRRPLFLCFCQQPCMSAVGFSRLVFAHFCILYLLLILFGGCRSTQRSSERLLLDRRRTWVEWQMATSHWSTREASATISLYVKPTYLPTYTHRW